VKIKERFKSWISALASLLAAGVMFGCAGEPVVPVDPLIGRIASSADDGFVSSEELMRVVAAADVVYLGEKHNNPRHREIQTEVIGSLLALDMKPVLVFETFSVDQTSTLLNYLDNQRPPLSAAPRSSLEQVLRSDLGWGSERDHDWKFYGSVLQIARANQLSAFGMDLPRGIRARLQTVGADGLMRVEQRRLLPTGFNNPAYRRLMYKELKSAHCGWGTEEYLSRLYDTWVARNDAMATVITDILDQEIGRPVVVIVGGGHVRYNEGLFERVAHIKPAVVQVNLGLREVNMQPAGLDEYLEVPEAKGVRRFPEHEYLWFTPRVSYKDPCEQFLKHRKKT